jgi:ribose 5-phosphate isomerase B
MQNKVFIASDHAGYALKKEILKTTKIHMFDLGTNSEESVDYPDFASNLINTMKKNHETRGILICGSGIGMSIVANRYSHIRAGIAFNSEIAKLMRQHNNANVLVLPGRFIDIHEALKCVDNFLTIRFDSGRHENRIKKIDDTKYE